VTAEIGVASDGGTDVRGGFSEHEGFALSLSEGTSGDPGGYGLSRLSSRLDVSVPLSERPVLSSVSGRGQASPFSGQKALAQVRPVVEYDTPIGQFGQSLIHDRS
jgi:hypothetical protein